MELATGIAFAGICLWVGPRWELLPLLYFAAISVALTLIDLDTFTLPNRIVGPSYLVLLALFSLSAAQSSDLDFSSTMLRACLGGVVLLCGYFLIWWIYPRGMGFGDVKLAGLLGLTLAYYGWHILAVGAFAGFFFGALFSVTLVIFRKAGRKSKIPFGPWMILGTWFALTLGNVLWNWYLSIALGS